MRKNIKIYKIIKNKTLSYRSRYKKICFFCNLPIKKGESYKTEELYDEKGRKIMTIYYHLKCWEKLDLIKPEKDFPKFNENFF